MGQREFVAFVAISLAVGALAIDLMLPALSAITNEFSLSNDNFSQASITALLLGVGVPQLLFGPVSDRFGRRPVLLGGLIVFILGGMLTALAPDFSTLLAARFLQGLGVGAQRMAIFSIVRDHYSGITMARIMSLVMTGLLIEPMIAPMLGQAIMLIASWRWIAGAITCVSLLTLGWALVRLDESLPPERRRSIALGSVIAAYRSVITHQTAFNYILAFGLVMAAHLGFLTSAQGIFQKCFDAGLSFTLLLALVSLAMSTAAFVNSRLVRHYGSPQLIRIGLYWLFAVNLMLLVAAWLDLVTLPIFMLVQAGNMFCFGLLLPNLTAMSINPLGHIAGTASSMFGFLSTIIGALLGFFIGQLFDGTIRPMAAGYVLLSAIALLILSRTSSQH